MARLWPIVLSVACANHASPGPVGAEAAPPASATAKVSEALTSNGVEGRPPKMVAVAYDRCPEGGTLEAPIAIQDRARVVRDPPLTSFVVPVAKQANLRSLNAVGVYDETGRRLPAQLEVLSRWEAHPDDCAQPIQYAYTRVSAVPEPEKNTT